MGNVTEKDILSFAAEFVKRVYKINHLLIYYGMKDYYIHWGNKKLMLYEIYKCVNRENDPTPEALLEKCTVTETDVGEFTGKDKCIAYLVCEGELYNTMYYYQAYGDGGKKAKSVWSAAQSLSKKYGMWFDWSSGAMIFYESENSVKSKKTDCFYDMVRKWTVSDYKTPGIKAEVILDMLISEFVEDLLGFYFNKKVVLLTKELPIRIHYKDSDDDSDAKADSNLNAKVDYLVCADGKRLVMVELKTTNESYSDPQKNRMEKTAEHGAAKLIEFYKHIANLDLKKSAKEKYNYSIKMYTKNLDNNGLNEDEFSKLDYMYILLTKSPDIPEKKQLVITDYCRSGKKKGCKYDEFKEFLSEERRKLWDKVSGILFDCAHCFDEGNP